MSLEGKTAVITGASGGIGAAVARMLHERGVNLGLASRSGDDLGLENVVAHAQPSYSRPATTLPNGLAVANNGGSSGLNFFERLFGAPTPPPAPIGRRPQRVFTR